MVNINIMHWIPFGCPTYCLDNTLQNQKKINKWQQRARVRLYFGFLAQHARTVALVLNIRTRLTSPQFHVQFNTKFETMRKVIHKQHPGVSLAAKVSLHISKPRR
jgi:hypothetical protein